MPYKLDLTGQVFGRLTVLSPAPSAYTKTYWHCQCDCGTACTVQTACLKNRVTRSCGCLKRETWLAARTKHGLSKTPEYILWKHIAQRTEDPHCADYKNYGARGIRVADYWRHDFAAFREDLLAAIGPKPSDAHSLDRVDNEGHYERGNLRWSTPPVQNNNQRKTHRPTLNGERHTIREWAAITGLPYHKLASRFYQGWSDHRALTQPIGKRMDKPGRYKTKPCKSFVSL